MRIRPIAAACSGMLFVAGASYAQQAPSDVQTGNDATTKPADNVETVVVTGMRHSIETSVSAKRNSDSIVEVISAEDIGKLPDVSIAESLARLPGLAAQRVDGRSQSIAVRGMAPKFTTTLLNGREMVSTGDNRSVEFDQFPSELINRVTVYKTPDATLSAVGMAGTINMQSIRPLDYKERVVTFNARAEKNSNGDLNPGSNLSDTMGGRLSASYVNQFANNTIGVAVGFAHLDNPGQEKYYKSWWWADTSQWGATPAGLPAGTTALNGFETGVTSTQRKRDGLMAVLEFQPNKDFHSMVDMYLTKFRQKSIQREFQLDLTQTIPAWGGTASYSNPVITNGVLTAANINGVNPIVLNRYNDRKDDVFSIGWNNELKRDKWTFGADLSYSRAKRDESNGEITAQATAPVNLIAHINTMNTGPSTFTPSIDFSNPASVLLTQEWGRGGRVSLPNVHDDIKGLKLSAKREFDGPISSVEAGVNYSDRNKKMDRQETYFYLNTPNHAPVAVPAGLLQSPSSLSFAGIPSVLSFDYNAVLSQFYTQAPSPNPWDLANRVWTVNEKEFNYFAKVDFDIDASVPIRGNLGVQAISTKQNSTGMTWNGQTLVPTQGGKTRTDVLPSLNAIFDLAKFAGRGTQVRLGMAEEMARPNMEDMRAGSNISLGCNTIVCTWSGSGGNPNLDPWRATATDLSIEKYFGKRSYLSVAHFRKNLKTFVYDQSVQENFSGIPLPAGTPAGVFIAPTGTVTVPANGTGGIIEGDEFSVSLEGALIHPALDGFGVIGTTSHTKSSLPFIDKNGNRQFSQPMEGLSGQIYNVTAYYEKAGFSARVSQRYRSPFTAMTRDQFGGLVPSTIGSEKIIDAQLGYTFEGGQYKGLSILFQVTDLNNEPYRTYVGSSTGGQQFPERYNTFGRQYLLGLTYKM